MGYNLGVTPKRALWALLGLAGIAICLLSGALIDKWRKLRNKPTVPLPLEPISELEPKPFPRFGVNWDFAASPNPLCPACNVLLHLYRTGTLEDGTPWERLRCPQCHTTFELRDDHGNRAMLIPAKNSVYQEQINEGMRQISD